MSAVYECSIDDAPELAELHAAAFGDHEAWKATEIRELLAQTQNRAFAIGRPAQAFIIVQHFTPEAEILTLATVPKARRMGYAMSLITRISDVLSVSKWLLDVAADNHTALALYERLGFKQDAIRAKYYRRTNGRTVDAVLMSLRLAGHG